MATVLLTCCRVRRSVGASAASSGSARLPLPQHQLTQDVRRSGHAAASSAAAADWSIMASNCATSSEVVCAIAAHARRKCSCCCWAQRTCVIEQRDQRGQIRVHDDCFRCGHVRVVPGSFIDADHASFIIPQNSRQCACAVSRVRSTSHRATRSARRCSGERTSAIQSTDQEFFVKFVNSA